MVCKRVLFLCEEMEVSKEKKVVVGHWLGDQQSLPHVYVMHAVTMARSLVFYLVTMKCNHRARILCMISNMSHVVLAVPTLVVLLAAGRPGPALNHMTCTLKPAVHLGQHLVCT